MPPTNTLAYTYVTRDDLDSLLSVLGTTDRVDDDNTGAVSAAEQGFIDKAIQWATDKINFYLAMRYNPSDLSQSWMVNDWCAIVACYFLATRRGNPSPASIIDLYQGAIRDLELVHSGAYEVPLTPLREVGIPAWSNIRVDVMYNRDKIRVLTTNSEKTPTPYRQKKDWGSLFTSDVDAG